MTPPVDDRTQLLDALWACQKRHGYIRDEDVASLADALAVSKIEIEGVVSFYHFLHRQPTGDFTVYLDNSIVSECKGFARVKQAFEHATGSAFGRTPVSRRFGLFETACIGLSDQQPAALINFYPFTNLNTLKVKQIVAALERGEPASSLCDEVANNIRFAPGGGKAIFLRDYEPGRAVRKLVGQDPQAIIDEVGRAQVRGMGGAFFPTAIKWASCRQVANSPKYVVCNADEGEPGTFKDRVLLNKYPGLVLEGMIIAAYAVGASAGIVYLRAEYQWLKHKVEAAITDLRRRKLLGTAIAGIAGFDFDIRIQLGAGAYVCGEETALLNSLEGKRGEPRTKYFYPTEKGFLDQPTVVNNVETCCAVARVLELGADHFLRTGTTKSPGTKLLSISGDCRKPGIYEVEWGTSIHEVLALCGANAPHYIQVSGPSGECVSLREADRRLALDDLRCGGSFMIFDHTRDILGILRNFTEFFKHESCGVCTPCRAGNFLVQRKLTMIGSRLARASDFSDLHNWGKVIGAASRCGLGVSATNSLRLAIERFPEYFKSRIIPDDNVTHFDLEAAVKAHEEFR